jgi:hypothetical protein
VAAAAVQPAVVPTCGCPCTPVAAATQ